MRMFIIITAIVISFDNEDANALGSSFESPAYDKSNHSNANFGFSPEYHLMLYI